MHILILLLWSVIQDVLIVVFIACFPLPCGSLSPSLICSFESSQCLRYGLSHRWLVHLAVIAFDSSLLHVTTIIVHLGILFSVAVWMIVVINFCTVNSSVRTLIWWSLLVHLESFLLGHCLLFEAALRFLGCYLLGLNACCSRRVHLFVIWTLSLLLEHWQSHTILHSIRLARCRMLQIDWAPYLACVVTAFCASTRNERCKSRSSLGRGQNTNRRGRRWLGSICFDSVLKSGSLISHRLGDPSWPLVIVKSELTDEVYLFLHKIGF